jgi:hypothetical protein
LLPRHQKIHDHSINAFSSRKGTVLVASSGDDLLQLAQLHVLPDRLPLDAVVLVNRDRHALALDLPPLLLDKGGELGGGEVGPFGAEGKGDSGVGGGDGASDDVGADEGGEKVVFGEMALAEGWLRGEVKEMKGWFWRKGGTGREGVVKDSKGDGNSRKRDVECI